jgi:hypothetical protein
MALFGKKEPSLRDKKLAMGLSEEEASQAPPAPRPAPRSEPAVPAAQPQGQSQAKPTNPQNAYCRICSDYRPFKRCWLRVGQLPQCPCCGHAFENRAAVYAMDLPVCPKCGEYLEHPGFQYGLCDGCGSKYELMEGTVPSLLPNRQQRAEMEKHGKSWSRG